MRLLFSAEEISRKVRELGKRITEDYRNSRGVVLVGVLKGAVVFLSDLMRAMEIDPEVEFIRVSSYGNSTSSSGEVKIVGDVHAPLEGKDVLVVDCIVDSGLTMEKILHHLRSNHRMRSLEVCALLVRRQKVGRRDWLKYAGFEIGEQFVVGYGLDLAGRYRNLPYIAAAL